MFLLFLKCLSLLSLSPSHHLLLSRSGATFLALKQCESRVYEVEQEKCEKDIGLAWLRQNQSACCECTTRGTRRKRQWKSTSPIADGRYFQEEEPLPLRDGGCRSLSRHTGWTSLSSQGQGRLTEWECPPLFVATFVWQLWALKQKRSKKAFREWDSSGVERPFDHGRWTFAVIFSVTERKETDRTILENETKSVFSFLVNHGCCDRNIRLRGWTSACAHTQETKGKFFFPTSSFSCSFHSSSPMVFFFFF